MNTRTHLDGADVLPSDAASNPNSSGTLSAARRPTRPRSDRERLVRQVFRIGGLVLAVVLTGVVGLNVVELTAGKVYAVDRQVFDDRVTSVRLSSESGDLRITGTAGDSLVVEARMSGTITVPELSVVVSEDGRSAELHADCPGPFWSCQATFDVTLPAGVALDASTSSGDVEASELVGSVTLRTSSGDVRVDGANGDRLVMRTSSGDVEAFEVDVDDLDLRTSSGDVTAVLGKVPQQVEAVTSSGDVLVVVPYVLGDVYYDVEASTSSGDRVVDVRTDPVSDRRIGAHTSSGDVTVQYAPES